MACTTMRFGSSLCECENDEIYDVGQPILQLNYVVCLVLAYPLAELFRFLPTQWSTLRHIVGLLLGLLFGFFCFGTFAVNHQ